MADEHFSHEVIERFFRAELSRGENREVVRHLLTQCPRCSRLAREVAHGQRLQCFVDPSRSGGGSSGSGSPQQVLNRILRLVGRGNRSPRRRRRGLAIASASDP